MIVIPNKQYRWEYQYGGSSIFSSLTRSLSKAAMKETAKKLAADTAKKLVNEAAKQVANKAVEKGTDLLFKKKPSVTPPMTKEAKDTLHRILNTMVEPVVEPVVDQSINALIDGSGITDIQDYVKRGRGIKTYQVPTLQEYIQKY